LCIGGGINIDDSCNDYLKQPKSLSKSYYSTVLLNKNNLKYEVDSNLKPDQNTISNIQIAVNANNIITDGPNINPIVTFFAIDSGKLLIKKFFFFLLANY